jgi:hypothetical protein
LVCITPQRRGGRRRGTKRVEVGGGREEQRRNLFCFLEVNTGGEEKTSVCFFFCHVWPLDDFFLNPSRWDKTKESLSSTLHLVFPEIFPKTEKPPIPEQPPGVPKK